MVVKAVTGGGSSSGDCEGGSGCLAKDRRVKVSLEEDIYKSPTGGGGFLAGVMTLNYNIYRVSAETSWRRWLITRVCSSARLLRTYNI